jgi:hypothetical protein
MKLDTLTSRILGHIRRRQKAAPLSVRERRARAKQVIEAQEAANAPPPEIGELEEYLFFQRWIKVVSSNVGQIQYDADSQKLQIEFLNGSVYTYDGITIGEAEDFAFATSKGKWVWRHLRQNRFGRNARKGEKATVVYAFTVSRVPRKHPPRRIYDFTSKRTTTVREVERTKLLTGSRSGWEKRRKQLGRKFGDIWKGQ